MLKAILFVGAGSFAGGTLRFLIARTLYGPFPWGTLIVNITGCLLIGLLYGFFERTDVFSPEIRLLLTVGLCGSFTTFSAFIGENLSMLRSGEFICLILYTAASIVLGLAAVWLGSWLMKTM